LPHALPYLGAILIALASVASRAQVAVDQFEPAPLPSDGFALSSPTLLAAREWTLSGALEYAKAPLQYEIGSSVRARQVVVGEQLVLHVGGAYALHRRVLLFASLPLHVLMRGDPLLVPAYEPEGGGLGDLRLGTRIGLWADPVRGGVAAELIARVPSAELADRDQRYSGDEAGSYDATLLGELRVNNVDFRARLGVRLRKEVELQNLHLGSALLFAAGARVRVTSSWSVLAELNASTFLSSPFGKRETPLELLLGTRMQRNAWSLGIGAGPGLTDGYGTPSFRLLSSAAYVHARPAKAIPRQGPAAVVDADGDALLPPADRCPDVPEDRDGVSDEDGCPEADVVAEPSPAPAEPECVGANGEAVSCSEREAPDEAAVQESTNVGEAVEFGRVEYAVGKGSALASSIPTLLAVRTILSNNPQIELVRVEGHSDDTGTAEYNQHLARRRARAVVRWLIERGIAPTRLEAYACSDLYPREPDTKKQGLQANRRVEFHVLEPSSTPHDHPDCEPLDRPEHP
jgi:outer membrane protein OmpA-like peptidoglycan-associated protein